MIGVIKSCTPNGLGDLMVTVKVYLEVGTVNVGTSFYSNSE